MVAALLLTDGAEGATRFSPHLQGHASPAWLTWLDAAQLAGFNSSDHPMGSEKVDVVLVSAADDQHGLQQLKAARARYPQAFIVAWHPRATEDAALRGACRWWHAALESRTTTTLTACIMHGTRHAWIQQGAGECMRAGVGGYRWAGVCMRAGVGGYRWAGVCMRAGVGGYRWAGECMCVGVGWVQVGG